MGGGCGCHAKSLLLLLSMRCNWSIMRGLVAVLVVVGALPPTPLLLLSKGLVSGVPCRCRDDMASGVWLVLSPG
jgi:hypothetical protein